MQRLRTLFLLSLAIASSVHAQPTSQAEGAEWHIDLDVFEKFSVLSSGVGVDFRTLPPSFPWPGLTVITTSAEDHELQFGNGDRLRMSMGKYRYAPYEEFVQVSGLFAVAGMAPNYNAIEFRQEGYYASIYAEYAMLSVDGGMGTTVQGFEFLGELEEAPSSAHFAAQYIDTSAPGAVCRWDGAWVKVFGSGDCI